MDGRIRPMASGWPHQSVPHSLFGGSLNTLKMAFTSSTASCGSSFSKAARFSLSCAMLVAPMMVLATNHLPTFRQQGGGEGGGGGAGTLDAVGCAREEAAVHRTRTADGRSEGAARLPPDQPAIKTSRPPLRARTHARTPPPHTTQARRSSPPSPPAAAPRDRQLAGRHAVLGGHRHIV